MCAKTIIEDSIYVVRPLVSLCEINDLKVCASWSQTVKFTQYVKDAGNYLHEEENGNFCMCGEEPGGWAVSNRAECARRAGKKATTDGRPTQTPSAEQVDLRRGRAERASIPPIRQR